MKTKEELLEILSYRQKQLQALEAEADKISAELKQKKKLLWVSIIWILLTVLGSYLIVKYTSVDKDSFFIVFGFWLTYQWGSNVINAFFKKGVK